MVERWRYWAVIAGLLVVLLGLIGRIVDLMIIDRLFLQGQGNARSLRTVSIPAYRGLITDRNGEPLAVSTPVDSIWVDPKTFTASAKELASLAQLLNLSAEDIQHQITSNSKKEFLYLKRDLNPYTGSQIKNLAIPGVFLQREFRRYYPEGEVTAQLVGLTNVDDQGQEGEELAYNRWLAGVPGKKRVLQDRLGRVVDNVGLIQEPQPGRDLALSIDSRIQYLAYRELETQVRDVHAQSGSVIVMDAQTGEVLAMVNQPSYNPNDRPSIHDGRFRNRAVTDVVEPGSTMKAFSVANALESGKYKPNTIIDTRPGWWTVLGKRVRDDNDNGVLTVTGVLQKSSNVGVSKMTLSLSPLSFWEVLKRTGFGQLTDSNFPGESSGVLVKDRIWRPFALATMSFGYGLSVTSIQLAQAYTMLAAGGIKRPVSLLRIDSAKTSERVIPLPIAKELLTMMLSVVEKGGTAPQAKIPGYTVTGKTGTARMVGPHGYEKNHHVALFVGIAPASKPRLVVSVVIKDPHGHYFGGEVSAPVFAKIMGGALRILNIPPDDLHAAPQNILDNTKQDVD
jgi:cell division protein FtsI (penicillin-binding protein 3)